jgi:hypothetical protein
VVLYHSKRVAFVFAKAQMGDEGRGARVGRSLDGVMCWGGFSLRVSRGDPEAKTATVFWRENLAGCGEEKTFQQNERSPRWIEFPPDITPREGEENPVAAHASLQRRRVGVR